MASIINASTSGAGGVITTADASGELQLQTAGTTRQTIDINGNVGIGVTPYSTWDTATRRVIEIGRSGTGITGNPQNGATNFQCNLIQTTSGSIYANTGYAIALNLTNGGGFGFYNYGTGSAGATTSAPTIVASIDANANFNFNSGYGSSATAYGCRAWVTFNGTGTVAILGSGNVTSITDNGTGDYTINMTTAMPDVNYSIAANAAATGSVDFQCPIKVVTSTSAFSIYTSNGTTLTDSTVICAQVFR